MKISLDTTKMPPEVIGWRIGKAAEFLINLLAGTELPSVKVYQLANEAGIMQSTLNRAKRIAGVKARKNSFQWLLSVPEEMKRYTFTTTSPRLPKEYLLQPIKTFGISSDWVSVVAEDDGGEYKAGIPARVSSGGLRVKVGQYEFEVDKNFPSDKLAEILRGMAVQDG